MNFTSQLPGVLSALQALLLAYAAATDVATRMIPDSASLIVALLGILGLLLVDPPALLESFLAAAVLFLLLLVMHARGWMGGGDVKLLTALAVGLPLGRLGTFLMVTVLAGGVVAFVYLLLRLLPCPARPSAGASAVQRIWAIERWRVLRRGPLPYGVAIACGGIWSILGHGA